MKIYTDYFGFFPIANNLFLAFVGSLINFLQFFSLILFVNLNL